MIGWGKTSLRIAVCRYKKLLQKRLPAQSQECPFTWLVLASVWCDVHRLPFALDDAGANLRGDFSLARLFVAVEILIDARAANGTMLAGEAVEQTGVAMAAVAVAVARLLVERLLDFGGHRVGVLHHWICKEIGVDCCG